MFWSTENWKSFLMFSHLLFRIFRVVLLFNYQASLKRFRLFLTDSFLRQRDIYYHAFLKLSTLFFKFFHFSANSRFPTVLQKRFPVRKPKTSLCHQRLLSVKNTVWYNSLCNGEGGIWTLAPLLTTYSLSRGAPSASWVLLQNKADWINLLPKQ